jgi:6-pyruvoyltetrahydropterin/6-carboxytetrahydropterin synthase
VTHRVSVSKDYLTFSAAHFLTIPGHKCESLHGHNYVVTVAVEGEVDPDTGFVIDFAVLKRVLRPTIDRLDHRVLLPGRNPGVGLRERDDGSVAVDVAGAARFVFPRAHVAVVPVTDTTAELLAEHLAREVVDGLGGAARGIRTVDVQVEESPGQQGAFRIVVNQEEVGRANQ